MGAQLCGLGGESVHVSEPPLLISKKDIIALVLQGCGKDATGLCIANSEELCNH